VLPRTFVTTHATLRRLDLVATQHSRPTTRTGTSHDDAAAELAAWWNNLAIRQAEVGQRTEALHSITEAVTHHRQLAQANPAAFLPNLATSLNNLANQLAAAGQQAQAVAAYDQAVAQLRPAAQAELLLHRARWRAEQGDTDGVGDDVRRAATAADDDDDPAWAGRARRAVRAVAEDLATGEPAGLSRVDSLPAWAREPLPDQLLETLNRWTNAPGWASREDLLRECHADLLDDPGQRALHLAEALYSEVEEIPELRWVLGQIAEHGLEPVLAEMRAGHAHTELLDQWLAAATWADSHEFARRHPQLLADPRTAATLEAHPDDPMLVQHLGIVRLAARLPLDDVYDLVIDPTMAVDAAMGAVEEGDVATLTGLLLAAPHLGSVPFAGPYLLGTLLALSDAADQGGAEEQMRSAADQGTETQRAAGAARLSSLARRLPHLADRLILLAGILTASA